MSARSALEAGLPAMRAAAPGAVALARLLWHVQRAEAAWGRGRFEASWEQLWRVGQLMSPHTPGVAAWRELTLSMLEVCVRGALKPQLAETFEQYGWLAWRSDEEVWEAAGLILVCEEAGTWSTGAHLGDLMARQWPASALGAVMAAHFRELELLASRELGGPRQRAVAQRFERALELASQQGRDVRMIALRAGVALMLEGREKSRGRALLRGLKADELGADAQRWYALGMARSDFWLDRVRAADILSEQAEALEARDHGGRAALLAMLRFLMTQDTLELRDAEADRLDALIAELAQAEERARLRELLKLRELTTARGELGPRDAPEITAQLAQMSAAQGGAWRATAAAYRELGALLDASAAPSAPSEWPGDGDALGVARLAGELLWAARTGGAARVQSALADMGGEALETLTRARPAELRPMMAAWPTLLELIAGRGEEAEEQAREALRGQLVALFMVWVERAPAPTCGWWELSAHMARAGLMEAAERAAERAWGAGEVGEEVARGFASGKLLAWVITQGDQGRMLKWLERMAPSQGAQ